MLFLVLLTGVIVQDYVVGGSSFEGELTISTKAIDLMSNIQKYSVNCSLQFKNKSNNIQFLRILENGAQLDAEILNNSTISYTAQVNQSHTECGEKRYTCEYFGAKIGEQVITVGEPPTLINPAKFKCISENLNYLHCRFPANRSHCQAGTSYSLLMVSAESFESCKLTKEDDSFRFDSRDQSCQYPVDEEVIEFQLRASNQFGSVTQKILVDHYDIVRPATPHNVKLKFDGERFLSWNSKKNLNYFERKFEYNFRCKNESLIQSARMIFRWPMRKIMCAQPKVRLRVIPENSNEEAIWSDWGVFESSKGSTGRSKQGTRLSDESMADRVIGVFNYIEDNNQSMTIEVFWQRESSWNVSNVVAVSETGITYKPSWSILHPKFGRSKFHNLNREKYDITLEGSPPGKINLLVQPTIAHYQPRFKKLLNNNKSFEVSWYPPDNQDDLLGYTVMYCHLTATRVCEESVVFQTLTPTDTSFNIYSEKTLNFAVSAQYSDYSSSLVWQQCIITPTSNTHNKSPKFHFFDVFSSSLKLRLEPSCEDRSLYELLKIHVIDTTSGKPVTSRTYQPHESVVEIPDLAADTSYEVLVVAYNGSNVPHEARARVTTKKTGSDDRLSVYIVTGVVLLIAMISSTYRVTVRIRAIMNVEVEFPFGLLDGDDEPVMIYVESARAARSDGKGRNYVVDGEKQAYLEVIQEEDMGNELACGRCGVTPSKLGGMEVINQQQDNGYLSVDVIMKRGM